MDSVPLREARNRLGKICTAAAHAGTVTEITRHGGDPVVVIPRSAYEELQRLRRADVERQTREAAEYLRRGEIPPGTERVTREDLMASIADNGADNGMDRQERA
ncbi:prevent-host-death family protein [Thermomonospora echinospora]|uniref:Antitoxin n=1 Tax=Thermomonospora echinospora TaxID=1992 RepID=A0A1H6E3Z2_9ACTN|nr:type II toxin-antitoxin system Phd/YefM family antitoxin [Thermomonospora echinospora]SEG92370.1 prevent-host-death family protein [Thermomonospora echinospora]